MDEKEKRNKRGHKPFNSLELGESDEDIFLILSHPIRRRIIQHLTEAGSISFSELSKEWKLSTGVIYHHLSILGSLIKQNSSRRYILTDKGRKIADWLFQDRIKQVEVEKINALSYLVGGLIEHISTKWLLFLFLSLGIIILGKAVVIRDHGLIIGPLFALTSVNWSVQRLAIVSFVGEIGGLLITIGLGNLFSSQRKGFEFNRKAITSYFLASSFSHASVILAIVLGRLFSIIFTELVWEIVFVIAQLWFLFIDSTALAFFYSLKLERAMLSSLLILYLILMIFFFTLT